ncbi:MAG: GNAT family N-acetyltransferase [Clostridia bacterium]|nr:GNAT family N-acetyltransferase [Clostridia bacterium]
MFRKATSSDIDAINSIYLAIHTEEENDRASTGWKRDIYPTRKTAEDSVKLSEMFVCEKDGKIIAAAKINKTQEKEYANINWKYISPADKVMVIHTLAVSPALKGNGIGTAFIEFYENYAKELGCSCLRLDTNEKNTAARALYKKLGYIESGIIPTVFNGISGVNLVCLEKNI